ncbi:hypothetical protein LguiA_002658 [Lonicera macranthoides]
MSRTLDLKTRVEVAANPSPHYGNISYCSLELEREGTASGRKCAAKGEAQEGDAVINEEPISSLKAQSDSWISKNSENHELDSGGQMEIGFCVGIVIRCFLSIYISSCMLVCSGLNDCTGIFILYATYVDRLLAQRETPPVNSRSRSVSASASAVALPILAPRVPARQRLRDRGRESRESRNRTSELKPNRSSSRRKSSFEEVSARTPLSPPRNPQDIEKIPIIIWVSHQAYEDLNKGLLRTE